MRASAPVAALHWAEPAPRAPSAAKALPLLRAAVEAAPEHVEARRRLAAALFRLGRLDEVLAVLKPAARDEAAPPELLLELGRAAAFVGDHDRALAALRRAADRGATGAYGHLADVLQRRGQEDEALDAGQLGLDVAPEDHKPLGVIARTLVARGDDRRLWAVCAGLRERGAWNPYLPSAMAHAARGAAERAEVASLVDREGLFARSELHADDALTDELLGHPALGALPATRTTTGTGGRLDDLHLEAGPHARELLAAIRAAVEAYSAERAGDGHPVLARRPRSATLTSWAIVVGADGHEGWHVHPGAWLSGVFYVAVPPTSGDRAGTIEFGPLPFGSDAEREAWPRWHVRPRAGELLLFPSFYGHRTWPTGTDAPRLCVAFDVLPR